MGHIRRLLVMSLIVGGLAPGSARAATQYVAIDGISFVPARVEILPGDSVAWENLTDIIHTVTDRRCVVGGGCAFDEEMSPDEWFVVTFPEPGITQYQCRIHGFSAEVVVADPPGTLPDLAPTAIEAAPSTAFGVPVPTTTRLTVTLANEGTAAAPAPEVRVEYRYRGAWHPVAHEILGPLGAGETASFDALWDTSHLVGDFRIRAVADPARALEELREANNAFEELIAVHTIPGAAPGLDLLDPLG
jgi:plastocyanin